MLETAYVIAAEDGGLLLTHRRRGASRIEPKQQEAFSGDFPFTSVTFEHSDNGAVTGFRVWAGGTQELRFDRQD